jgi:PAS domain S-box-containing protein
MGSHRGAIKILCVDDQESNLTALQAVLGGADRATVCVRSGSEALSRLSAEEFALILLDVQMPGMDGFETARRIRSLPGARTTPIIFLTANYPKETHEQLGYEAGAVDYLFKPLNTEVLKAKVDVFIDLFNKTRLLQEASERKYQKLVEGIRDGIVWSANLQPFQFTFVSSPAEALTGYPPSQWLTDPELLFRILHPEDRDAVQAAILAIAPGESIGIDYRLIHRSGKSVWFHTEMHVEVEHGHAARVLRGLSVNITQLKENEQVLRAAVQMREDFLAIASHELRTPITPLQLQLQGFIHMIETGRLEHVSDLRLKEMLEISDSQVARLSRLVGQLLDVSRIGTGRFKMEPETVDLAHLVEDVLFQLRHEIEASECRVVLKLENNVRGIWDRIRIEQVLINLLTNATKYAAAKPIEIQIRGDEDRARLSVQDHGMGIAIEDQKRIFERFERAVSSKHFGGLGLGLFITKQIVEVHRGRISLESESGRGATFTVELPLNPFLSPQETCA